MIAEIVNPDYRFSSILKITPEWLRVHKYRAVLMDIDNTLAARNSWAVPEKHIDWLQKLQEQDIRIVLASNNGGRASHPAVAMGGETVSPGVCRCHPSAGRICCERGPGKT